MPPTSKRPRTAIMEPVPYEERILQTYTWPVIVQPKLNGERAIASLLGGKIILESSTGLEMPSVPHINDALEALCFNGGDGELYIHGMDRQDIHSIVSRKASLHPDYKKVKYCIFDLPALSDVDAANRVKTLNALGKGRGLSSCTDTLQENTLIQIVPSHHCNTITEVWDTLQVYMSQGYEGIVIRNPVALYTPGKAPSAIMKYKPKKQDIYKIVGFQEEVDQYGTPKGTLGSFLLEDARHNIFKSGSGLTKEQREQYWQTREALRGMYALIEYPELTKRGVPSQPIFKEIRKTPYDIIE